MIQVQSLRKEYGERVAVADISFEASAGEIFGLLGPNGAGKSTTIGCVSGLLEPTSRSVRVNGHDVLSEPTAARRVLGVVPQELALYEDLNATDNVSYWGAAYGLRGAELKRRVQEVLEFTGLAGRHKDAVSEFSGGMKRRLNFAAGIVHEPQVLLLDEPTVGVDPQSRVRLLEMVRDLADRGVCVLYTTHYMEEAESLCDRLFVIDHGERVAQGTLAELRTQAGDRDLLRLTGAFPAEVEVGLRALEGVELVSADADAITLAASAASSRLSQLFAEIDRLGGEVRETTMTQPSLESLFIRMTGKELRE
jgi:ABC-2 type transport system ATP-binding protein